MLLDLDSTVLTWYGHQEQARIGYNPRKRGRPSYHSLICFEGQTKDFWHGELRPGNVHTAHGTVALLTARFAKIPQKVRQIRGRGDVGFFDRKVVEAIEARKRKFVIVAKLTPPLRSRAWGIQRSGEGKRSPNVSINSMVASSLSLCGRAQDLADKPQA